MADWSKPSLTDPYASVLAELMARDLSAATLSYSADANIPNGAVRWNSNAYQFESFSSSGGNWSPWSIQLNVGTVLLGSDAAPNTMQALPRQQADTLYATPIWTGQQITTAITGLASATTQQIDQAVSSISSAYPGELRMFGMETPPAKWLVCNGAAVSRTTYALLFAAIGTTWGTGDGSTTFNLPDMRGRSPFGVGGTTAGRITTGGSGINADVLGITGGSELLQSHNHNVSDPGHNHSHNDPGHAHGVRDPGHSHTLQVVDGAGPVGGFSTSGNQGSYYGGYIGYSGTGIGIYASGTGVTNNPSGTGIGVSAAGSGNAQNIPPMAVVQYAIYAGT